MVFTCICPSISLAVRVQLAVALIAVLHSHRYIEKCREACGEPWSVHVHTYMSIQHPMDGKKPL